MKGSSAMVKHLLQSEKSREKTRGDDLGEKDTKIPCVIPECSGTIRKYVSRQYFGDPMNMIIGPGHARQLTETSELYCSQCGIAYHHLPKK